jgi:hypothetical protein
MSGVGYSASNGIWPSFYGEMFSTRVRLSGLAIGGHRSGSRSAVLRRSWPPPSRGRARMHGCRWRCSTRRSVSSPRSRPGPLARPTTFRCTTSGARPPPRHCLRLGRAPPIQGRRRTYRSFWLMPLSSAGRRDGAPAGLGRRAGWARSPRRSRDSRAARRSRRRSPPPGCEHLLERHGRGPGIVEGAAPLPAQPSGRHRNRSLQQDEREPAQCDLGDALRLQRRPCASAAAVGRDGWRGQQLHVRPDRRHARLRSRTLRREG